MLKVGPAVMAVVEMEFLEKPHVGKGKTVVLDDFFNREIKKDAGGREYSWHYKWEENHPGSDALVNSSNRSALRSHRFQPHRRPPI